MAKPTRTPSTDELDYQRRLDENFAPETRSTTGEPVEVYAPFAVEGNDTSGYVGVSPEYMTYASETEKPMRAKSGVEAKREERALDSVPVVAAPATSDLDADTSTQGGGNSSDLIYTASSGEKFTAKKAVAAGEGGEAPATEDGEQEVKADSTVASPAPVPPPGTPATP